MDTAISLKRSERYRTIASTQRYGSDLEETTILQALTAPPADTPREEPCPICGSREEWRWLDGRLLCRLRLVLDLAPLTLVCEGWDRDPAGWEEVA